MRVTFFRLLDKKVTKERATPSLRPLRGAKGQTCVGAIAGCAVELALRCARRSDNHGESDHEACALRRACSPRNRPAAGAASRGWTAEHPTAEQPHGPLLRSAPLAGASATRCAGGAERSDGPRGCPLGPLHEHRRLPAAKRRDAACRVALSLVTFFRRRKRKPLRRRAHTPASALKPSMLSQPARQGFDQLSPNGRLIAIKMIAISAL